MGPWCLCEYNNIAKIVGPQNVLITNISEAVAARLPEGVAWTGQSVLSMGLQKVCLLDLHAADALEPSDKDKIDYFLFGGILGDHPPRDRTSHLRPAGTVLRHLGPEQMSTDGAVNVCWNIINGTKLEDLKFCPFPLRIAVSAVSTVELPFKYLQDAEGAPCLPAGLRELVVADFHVDEDWCIDADDSEAPQ